MNQLNKIKWKHKLKLGLCSVLAGVATTGGLVPIIQKIHNQNNSDLHIQPPLTKWNYDNQNFVNQNALIQYINQQTTTKITNVPSENLYVFQDGAQTKYYNNKIAFSNALNAKVTTYETKSNISVDQFNANQDLESGLLSDQIVNQLNLKLTGQKGNAWKTQTVYQGKNDQIYDNETQAKLSYFDVNQVYQFNGIYFRNQADLKHYLNQYLNSIDGIKAKNFPKILIAPDLLTIKNPNIRKFNQQNLPTSDILEFSQIQKLNQLINQKQQALLDYDYNYQVIQNYIANNANRSLVITDPLTKAIYKINVEPNELSEVTKNQLINSVLNYGIDSQNINYTLITANKSQTTYACWLKWRWWVWFSWWLLVSSWWRYFEHHW